MKQTFFVLTALAIAVTTSIPFVSCISNTKAGNTNGEVVLRQDSLVKRGSYWVSPIGYDDCHSPKKFDPNGVEIDRQHRFSDYLSTTPGSKVNTCVMKNRWVLFAMDLTSSFGPRGRSCSANISSDAPGISNRKEEQFFKALPEGKSKGLKESHPLLPPMPWFVYKNMSATDIKAIFS